MTIRDPTQNGAAGPETFKKPENPEPLHPGLYLVSTPIGNLKDITLRALETLEKADVIACEDTRVSRKLLSAYGFRTPLLPYHDHNAEQQRPKILEKIERGQSIALISDAGTPLISDPGYKLVQEAIQKNFYVTSLPGANAPLTALQLSGLPVHPFVFAGFLPAKPGARRETLSLWARTPASLVFFETGARLPDTLDDLVALYADRQIALAREMTKKFEQVWRGTPKELKNRLLENGTPKGEMVLVIGPQDKDPPPDGGDIDTLLLEKMESCSLKDAVALVATSLGLPRGLVYARALTLRDGKPE